MSAVADADLSAELRERVRAALAAAVPLNIQGGGSKAFYGRAGGGEPFPVAGHAGLVEYEPTELVVTARGGTPLAALEAVLAAHGQMLAFEPPHFGPAATLGGTVACGLSGSRRPWGGAVRDAVLGVKLLNGRAEILNFGGRVLKNVAGFDVSRLQAGALGTLGVLLEVSLKVAARPEAEETLVFELDAAAALGAMSRRAGQPWPLSAACHADGLLYLRLSGAAAAIRASQARLGGEILPDGAAFWAGLREQTLGFFAQPGALWRISQAPAAPLAALPGQWLLDWGGALRWLNTAAPAEAVFAAAAEAGGYASLFRGGDRSGPVFQALPPPLSALHARTKRAFDPQGIFNPGRLYAEG